MSKLTKLTKAVPAKKALSSKKVVPAKNAGKSRFFTTPTYGDIEENWGGGWDELLAEFYIQSRDVSGTTPVIDPINIEKLINMVGLYAVATSGVNSNDYTVRQSFTGGEVSGQPILDALSEKYIARTKDSVINDLLNITLTYSGNASDDEEAEVTAKLFESVGAISEANGSNLGNITTWVEKKITIDISDFTKLEQKTLLEYVKSAYDDDETEALVAFRALTGDSPVDPTVIHVIAQILAKVPFDEISGLDKFTLAELMTSAEDFTEVFDEDSVPEVVTAYYYKVRIALALWSDMEGDVLSYLIDNVPTTTAPQRVIFKAVLDEFDGLADGYLYSLSLSERIELFAAKTHEILAYLLNEDEELTDLIDAIYENKDTTLLVPIDAKTGLTAAQLEKFAIMVQLNEKETHDGVELTYQMLGTAYAVLFKVTRPLGVITITSKVTGDVYTPAHFTSPDRNDYLDNETIDAILALLGVTADERIVLSVNGFSAEDDDDAVANLVTLVKRYTLKTVLKLAKGPWSNQNSPQALFLIAVGSDETNSADRLMKYSKEFVKSLLLNKNELSALQEHTDSEDFSANEPLQNGLLRLIDHGVDSNDIYTFLGTTDATRKANVKILAGLVKTDPEADGYRTVDWKNVNGLIVKAGISTFIDEHNGRMTVGDDATMADNWVVAFADSDVSEYKKLTDNFTAGELLTYTKTTKVYRVKDGRGVLGMEEITLAFNIDKLLMAYDITFEELQTVAALADVSLEQ